MPENKETFVGMEKYLEDIEKAIYEEYFGFRKDNVHKPLDQYEILWKFNKKAFQSLNEKKQISQENNNRYSLLQNKTIIGLLEREKSSIEELKKAEYVYPAYMKSIKAKLDRLETNGYFINRSINEDWKEYLCLMRIYNFRKLDKKEDDNEQFLENLALASFIGELRKVVVTYEQERMRKIGTKQVNRLIFSNPALEIFSLDKLNDEQKFYILALSGNEVKNYFKSKETDKPSVKLQNFKFLKTFEEKKQQLANRIIDIVFGNLYSQAKSNELDDNDLIVIKQYIKTIKNFMHNYLYKDPYDNKVMTYDELIKKKITILDKSDLKEQPNNISSGKRKN